MRRNSKVAPWWQSQIIIFSISLLCLLFIFILYVSTPRYEQLNQTTTQLQDRLTQLSQQVDQSEAELLELSTRQVQEAIARNELLLQRSNETVFYPPVTTPIPVPIIQEEVTTPLEEWLALID